MIVTPGNIRDETRFLPLLALVTGALPIIAINAAYLVAAGFETVPACIPYFDGCTSISSTGRNFPSIWIFKPLMFASAVTMALFFVRAGQATAAPARAGRDTVVLVGLVASAALVFYIIFLGQEGAVYRLLRRYGVTVFFGLTYLGQLLLARRFLRQGPPDLRHYARWMIVLCATLLAIGLFSIPVSNFVADKDQIENIIEWNFALLMQMNFLLAWRFVRRSKASQ